MRTAFRRSAALMLAVVAGLASAQQIDLGERRVPGKDHVALLSDSIEVRADKPQVVELRFRVDQGFHINSHTPKDELLIPTVLKLDGGSGTRVLDESYPAGTKFTLPIGDGEVLDVYQGEFRVALRVVASKGQSTWSGALHYQACDNAACFPPRTLPVKIAITAR
jgi:hypothetical protein